MKLFRWHSALCVAVVLALAAGVVSAQNKARSLRRPGIGYAYPAGGQQGTTFEVSVAGRYLDGVSGVVVSGGGVKATVIEHVKPLTGKQINLLRDEMKELQQKMKPAAPGKAKSGARAGANAAGNRAPRKENSAMQKQIDEIKKKLANPKNRNRENQHLAEDVKLRITVAADAKPGRRDLMVKTNLGLSNPVAFHVDQLPEYSEKEPNNKKDSDGEVLSNLPLIINGQIMPGDVDRFRLKLSKGTRLVMVVSARELVPYLADAVPGWFQATLGLYDAKGNEVAYVDDYRFNPDPVLFYEIGADGEYVLEIKDSIYRGREDFIYRIAVGELPFVTSIFPLGGRAGGATTIEMNGWNLPADEMTLNNKDKAPGIVGLSVRKNKLVSNSVPFAVDTLSERLEDEPNDQQASAQRVSLPLIVNGRIDKPGDRDVFRFAGRAGDEIVAEVYARRLNSPLDSVLKVTDVRGDKLIANDDNEDKGAGLTTHHADSRVSFKVPAGGTYYVHIGDGQQKGGTAYGYRLRIGQPRPDFELRVVPSSMNARAGQAVPVTVYALRKDGFAGDIALSLKDAPKGFVLNGRRIPADKEQIRLTLKVPPTAPKQPFTLNLLGRAQIKGRQVVRTAVPAEDMMQAFIYRHLVPAQELKVAVLGRANNAAAARNRNAKSVKAAPAKKPTSK